MYQSDDLALIQASTLLQRQEMDPESAVEDYNFLLNFFVNAQISAGHVVTLALTPKILSNESAASSLNDSSVLLLGSTNDSQANTDVRIVNTAKSSGSLEMPKWLIPSYTIILLFAIVGNALVISTLVQNRRMRTITNLFLLNLAISDILLGVLCMPVTLVGTLLRNFIFGEFLCKLIQFSQAASVAVSSWTLVAISCERYYAICHPLTSRTWQTISHAYKIIGFIWCGGILCMTPIAVFSQLIPTSRQGYRKCREHWPDDALGFERFYNIILDILLLVLPLIILCFAYIRITRTLYVGMQTRPSNKYTQNGSVYMDSTGSAGTDLKVFRIASSIKLITHTKRHKNECRGDSDPMTQADCFLSATNVTTATVGQNNATIAELRPADEIALVTTGCKPLEKPNNDVRIKASPSLRMADAALRRSNEVKTLESKKRVVKMLFVLVLEFFICWTPLYVINTLAIFIGPALYEYIDYSSISFLQLLAYSSSCCNPITYCFMNASFRRAFVDTFKGLTFAGGSATNTGGIGNITNTSLSGSAAAGTWPKREATVSISLAGGAAKVTSKLNP